MFRLKKVLVVGAAIVVMMTVVVLLPIVSLFIPAQQQLQLNNNNIFLDSSSASSTTATTTTTTTTKYEKKQLEQPSSSSSSRCRATASSGNGDDDKSTINAQCAYELAMERATARQRSMMKNESLLTSSSSLARNLQELYEKEDAQQGTTTTTTTIKRKYVLNLIRIPKAGSSALSVTGRALAGCMPDGYPCCAYTFGKEKKRRNQACPLPDLMCEVISGCVDHRPQYPPNVATMTSIREPTSRLLSGFFYTSPHRPKPVKDHTWTTFVQQYIMDPKYQNVLTKMLLGYYAYAPYDPSSSMSNVTMAQKRLCDMEWFGLSHNDIGSALLLYETHPFKKLIPNPVTFGLPSLEQQQQKQQQQEEGKGRGGGGMRETRKIIVSMNSVRVNKNIEYETFKRETFVENNGRDLVAKYNAEDIAVYNFALQLFCARVREKITPGLLLSSSSLASDLYGDCNRDENKNNKLLSSDQLCSTVQ